VQLLLGILTVNNVITHVIISITTTTTSNLILRVLTLLCSTMKLIKRSNCNKLHQRWSLHRKQCLDVLATSGRGFTPSFFLVMANRKFATCTCSIFFSNNRNMLLWISLTPIGWKLRIGIRHSDSLWFSKTT
jgi:hypothetical protein